MVIEYWEIMKNKLQKTKWLKLQPISSSSTSAGGSDNEENRSQNETDFLSENERPEARRMASEEMEKLIEDTARRFFMYGPQTKVSSSTNTNENSPLLTADYSTGSNGRYSYNTSGCEVRNESAVSVESCTFSGSNSSEENRMDCGYFLRNIKLVILVGVLLFCMVTLSFIKVPETSWTEVSVIRSKPAAVNFSEPSLIWEPYVYVQAQGPFLPQGFLNISQYYVSFTITRIDSNGTVHKISPTWRAPVAPPNLVQMVGTSVIVNKFSLPDEEKFQDNLYQVSVQTNVRQGFLLLGVSINLQTEVASEEVIMAAVLLVGLYVLIIFDLVHRTLAAMIAATTAIAVLALIGQRPSLSDVLSWLDVETLSLLFGMMVLVSILCETGFFDYVAVLAFRIARGRLWSLMCCLCLVTAILSAFLDNVTTILLMTPITIRLSEVMNMDPKYMLIALVMFANVGGAGTAVGDPPNVIIISNEEINKANIDFGLFTLHMFPGALIGLVGTMILIRILYRDVSKLRFSDPPEIAEMKHEIEVWKKAFHSLSGYSKDEDTVRAILEKKVGALETLLRKQLYDAKVSSEHFRENLKELSDTYKIKDGPLLVKSLVVIGVVIILFFLQSIPQLELSLGWTAILGAIILLILADFDELESVFSRVEWSTLLFFAALFVVMEALSQLKLLLYIGQWTQSVISSVGEEQRLAVAILLILWISAIASSIIDNIPFTTVMVKIVTELSVSLNLPLTPLVYALAFGACFGGNGTLVGASANVVCAGVAEQHGYRFTFYDFFKVGFPVMILTTSLAMVYLIICHVVLTWH